MVWYLRGMIHDIMRWSRSSRRTALCGVLLGFVGVPLLALTHSVVAWLVPQALGALVVVWVVNREIMGSLDRAVREWSERQGSGS